MKQQFIDRARLEARKENLARQIDVATAEAVVAGLTEHGFDIKAEYNDTAVRMEVTLTSGKAVSLQVNYKNMACGYQNLLNLLTRLQ